MSIGPREQTRLQQRTLSGARGTRYGDESIGTDEAYQARGFAFSSEEKRPVLATKGIEVFVRIRDARGGASADLEDAGTSCSNFAQTSQQGGHRTADDF